MSDDTMPQPLTRWKVVGGSVSDEERGIIEAARQKAGVKTMSEFVRRTMLDRSKLILDPPSRRMQDAA